MQKPVRTLILLLALIGLAFWGWRVFFPSPEHIIRSQLSKLAKAATFSPKDGALTRAFKAEQIPEFFTTNVVINFEVRGQGHFSFAGRNEVAEKAKLALAPGGLQGMKTEFHDITVKVAPDKQSASVNLTAKVTVQGQSDYMLKELNISFRKVDRKWLIYRVATAETLM